MTISGRAFVVFQKLRRFNEQEASTVLCVLESKSTGRAGLVSGRSPGENTLKDGSQIYGEIVEMTEGKMQVKALFHEGKDPITIKWSEVAGTDTEDLMSFVLGNGTILVGKPTMTQPGRWDVKTELLPDPIAVQLDSILAGRLPPTTRP